MNRQTAAPVISEMEEVECGQAGSVVPCAAGLVVQAAAARKGKEAAILEVDLSPAPRG